MSMIRNSFLAAGATLLTISLGTTPANAVDVLTTAISDSPAPEGYWRPMFNSPGTEDLSQGEADGLSRPTAVGACPAGTTGYTGTAAPFSCLEVYLDGSGHQVGLRAGRTGASAFGLLHAQLDHNVEAQTIEAAVGMNAAGIVQPNNRRLYGAEFVKDGEPVIEFEVIESRDPSTASPDDYALGVVTAYCRVGLSGPESVCPQWVNDTL
jgi:hypothetical protein